MIPAETSARQGLTTPAPVYAAPLPEPTLIDKQAWEMSHHEKAKVRAAAHRATRLYPGAVGVLVSRELLSFEQFGLRLRGDGVMMQAVHDIMTAPMMP